MQLTYGDDGLEPTDMEGSTGRSFHSSTFRLNVSTFYGIR